MGFIGTDQDHNIQHILKRAKLFLEEGKNIRIEPKIFSGLTKEHPHKIEYELYVDFKEVV